MFYVNGLMFYITVVGHKMDTVYKLGFWFLCGEILKWFYSLYVLLAFGVWKRLHGNGFDLWLVGI